MVDIYWAVKLQGEYPPQATYTEVNSRIVESNRQKEHLTPRDSTTLLKDV